MNRQYKPALAGRALRFGLTLAGRALLGIAFFMIGFCEGVVAETRTIRKKSRR